MAKFEEAADRLFRNVFVCKQCKQKMRASPMDVSQGSVKCRKCGSTNLRPKSKP